MPFDVNKYEGTRCPSFHREIFNLYLPSEDLRIFSLFLKVSPTFSRS